MYLIDNPLTEPYFNLATEEYLLDNFDENIFMLWRNEPSVIVGKFQNSLAEINLDYVKEKGIKVVRRQTGGGAVFHDLGNLNFTFIESNSHGDFRSFTKPILEVLQNMGVDARFEGRNDLAINGLKFSGNAQCVHKGRMLHHGTLLFDALMTDMTQALNVNPLKFQDKAVKSIRKRVTNISEHLPDKSMTVTDFAHRVMEHVRATHPDACDYHFSEQDLAQIQQLTDNKYSKWEWNFGQSPRYTFHKIAKTSAGLVEVFLVIEHSQITECHVFGDFFSKTDIAGLEQLLMGSQHREEILRERLNSISINDYISGITAEEFLELLC